MRRVSAASISATEPAGSVTGIWTARFVELALPVLLGRDDVTVQVTGTPAAYTEAEEAPLIAVSASDTADGHPDWFDLSVKVSVAGQPVPLSPLIAALALGDGPPRVYRIEPLGPIQDDPNVTDKRFPGNPTRSYRTTAPLRVVAEVADGLTFPADRTVRHMRARMAELAELGIEAMDD